MKVNNENGEGPSVTIVVACYRASAYLQACFESVIAQTITDWELLFIDDASPDDTYETALRLEKLDSRVRALKLAVNGGPSAARNLGIANARGDWIAILDADDAFVAERLQSLLAAVRDTPCDLVFDNMAPLVAGRRGGNAYWKWPEGTRMLSVNEMMRGCAGGGVSHYGVLKPFIRREYLEQSGRRYCPALRQGEDVHFHLSMMLAGAVTIVSGGVGYLYSEPAMGDPTRASQVNTSDRLLATDMLLSEWEGSLSGSQKLWMWVRRNNTRYSNEQSQFIGHVKSRRLLKATLQLMRCPWLFVRIGMRLPAKLAS